MKRIKLTKIEIERIYFLISRDLDKIKDQKEFNFIDTLRNKFKTD